MFIIVNDGVLRDGGKASAALSGIFCIQHELEYHLFQIAAP